MNGVVLPVTLRRTLDGYRHRRRSVAVLLGGFLSLAVCVGSVAAAVAADRLFRLGVAARGALRMAIGAAFLFCLGRWVLWALVRRLSDRRAAMRLGHRFPGLEEDLVTAVELSSSDTAARGVSRSLISSALRAIARRAHALDVRRAVPLRPVLETAGVLLTVLLVLGGAYWFRPEAVRNALARLVLADGSVPFFSYVKLRLTPRDRAVIAKGDRVDVKGAVSGRTVARARFEWAYRGDSRRVSLPCAGGVAEWKSGPLYENLRYRMSAGDARSEWRRVRVVPSPALLSKSAVLRTPAYAGAVETRVKDVLGALEIVAGTALAIQAEPVSRGSDPRFACNGLMRLGDVSQPLLRGDSGVLRSAFFKPAHSGELAIELTDGFGLQNRSPESVFVKVTPDRRPGVRIVRPGRDLALLLCDRVAVEAIARDEFGLRQLDLMWRIAPGVTSEEQAPPWRRMPLVEGSSRTSELTARTELNLAALGLAAGDRLEYRAMASDYAGDPVLRRAFSSTYRVVVISETEHLERVLSRLREVQLELLRLAAGEKTQAVRAGNLAEQAKGTPVHQESREAGQRELRNAGKTGSVADKVDGMLPELARNPSAPTGLLADLERLARAIQSVAAKPMKSAARDFAQAAASGQGRQKEQASSLQKAGRSAEEAARQLEQLARLAERLRRHSILDKLAADAERLAAQQRAVRETASAVAVKTAGRRRDELAPELDRAVGRLALEQMAVESGVDHLASDLRRAAESLAFSNISDAATAEAAGEKIQSDKLQARTAAVRRNVGDNILFSEMPAQAAVADDLEGVAAILRRRAETDEMEQIAKVLEEFIKRQTGINGGIEEAIAEKNSPDRSQDVAGRQSELRRDVAEQASALHWLAREIALFESATAAKLDAAAKEMAAGADDLYVVLLPRGLEHGRRALALLIDAREEFKEERRQMSQQAQQMQALEELLLLQRILVGQKKVNRDTVQADKGHTGEPQTFNRSVTGLAGRQTGLKVETKRLQRMLARMPPAAAVIGTAGAKMGVSRLALSAGDTGRETRVVQRQIVAILEKFMQENQGKYGGQGMGGKRMMALMQMLGGGGGGFEGGRNAPVMPRAVGRADDDTWLRGRARFEGRLASGFEATCPPEFRGLVDAYFDRLRREGDE